MDLIVTPSTDGKGWTMADLLGRPMGTIVPIPPEQFTIQPAGQAVEMMSGIRTGPHGTLDAALAEIERHTRGTCRHGPGQDRE